MKVTVAGSGGREHAIAWRLARSESVDHVTVVPGNAGIALEEGCSVVDAPMTAEAICATEPDLVVIGPEAPLVAGVAEDLRERGIAVVGPSRPAAALEGSKAVAKQFMVETGIPTAEFRVCSTPEAAGIAVAELGIPVAIKADGLAAGKGVVVCFSEKEADAAIQSIMNERLFGAAGDVVVVERALKGFEASVILAVDESGYLLFPTAQDHKQIGEGGVGPNTGGMGAVAPNPMITTELRDRIEREIVVPAVRSIQRRNWLFRGFLFIGLMIDGDRINVLEFNVRFGDPEAQAILPVINGDLGLLLRGLSRGRLSEAVGESGYRVHDGASCAVVAAAEGYPGPYRKGDAVFADPAAPMTDLSSHSRVFYAGVQGGSAPEELLTAGGRVLAVNGTGRTLEEARLRAYARLLELRFSGMQYRRDIGGDPIIARVLEEGESFLPQFEKRGGLLPVIVQDAESDEVLMLAYTNRAALEKTRATGAAWFWSTSRNDLWQKGETSGNTLRIREILIDCDQDALLYRVNLQGHGVCHTINREGLPRRRCFYRSLTDPGRLINGEP